MNKKAELIVEAPNGDFCPVRLMQKIMEGKWKFIILYYLMLKPTRFNELQRLIPNISHGVLTAQLKELEKYHIVDRRVLENKPPKVEYSLSKLGREFIPVMNSMIYFGKVYATEVPVLFEDKLS